MDSGNLSFNRNNYSGHFNELAKTIHEIIILVDPVEFRIQYINQIQPGFNKEEVLGAKVFDFVFPEHIEQYRDILNSVLSSRIDKTIELETDHRTNETGKAWYECKITPIKNESGEIQELIVISKDITEKKLSDIQIKNKEEKLYSIINNTNDIILSIDKQLRINEYNSVLGDQIFRGFGKKELNGSYLLDYIDPKKHEHLKRIYERVFSGETVNDIENFELSSGNWIYFESSYHPILDFNKQITGISIFSKDITKRIVNEIELKKALKEKEVLLAEIHHRIKNNLALVTSMLQLKEINIENAEAREALSDSRKRIKSTALVHEMLYRNDSFDNVKLKDHLKELFMNLNMNSTIQLKLEGENPSLNLDKALPFGLLINELMMNSIKHSFKNTQDSVLQINSEIENNVLKIIYQDSVGRFSDEIDFYNTETTGLMLIHTFIEQLNANIQLTSRNPPAYQINIPLI